jgi:hypothetical protein
MKLSDYKKTYYEFSGLTSGVARNLAFAGIALVWIFKTEAAPTPRITQHLIIPTVLLALTLTFDLLQYIAGTCVWGFFQWYHERKLHDATEDPELDSPSWLKLPQFTFFVLKLATVLSAYLFITVYIWNMCIKDEG